MSMRPKGGLNAMFGESKRKLSSGKLLKWAFSYLKPFRGTLSALIALLIISVILQAYSPIIIQIIIDQGVVSNKSDIILNFAILYSIMLVSSITQQTGKRILML